MRSDKPEHVQFEEEEHGENYIKDRVKSLALVKNLTFLTILLLIAQIVLDIIHLTIHGLGLAISLLTTAVVFLISAGIIIYWSGQATKAYKANTELFQPRVNDKLTKTVYIGALIFAATCVVLLINLLAQREYSPDYVVAHSAVQATWDEHYGGRTVAGINKFLRVISWIQVGFNIYYIIYFLVVARTAFKCLKFDNQAMSYLVFLGNTLLLAFGLGIVFLADHALGYSEYPQIKEHFPFWNIKGLYFAGVCVSVVSLIGFLVDHRSWRVGFFVLSFLLLVNIVLLGNFSGFAFRHIKETYDYYKGTGDIANCVDRMQYVNLHDLEHEGCPQKYLPAGTQCDNEPVTPWEQIETDVRQAERTRQPAAPTQTVTPAEAAQAQQEAAAAAAEAAAATQQAQDATAQAAEAQQAAADAQQAAADNQQATADQAAADQAAADQAAADQAAADQAAAQAAADQAAADQAAADQAAAQAAADQAAADQAAAQAAANQAAADQAAADQAAADQAAADQAANDQTPTTTATPGEQQQTAADQQAAADNQQATADQSSAAADQQQAVADQQQANADQQQANADTASDNATPASMLMEFTVMRKLQQSEDGKYCYNTKCCGLLGQLYTRDLLRLANFAVLAMLAAILISIACYYFWFVKWVDAARDKRKDYVWLFIMVLILVGFIVAMAAWNLPYVAEQLDANGRHMFAWSW